MPRLTQSIPKYRKHRASGQAVVTLSGVDHYLGPHGTKASKLEYDRVITEWLANGRQTLRGPNGVSVAELLAGYWQHAKRYYWKNGEATDTLSHVKVALRFLKTSYSHTQAADFGPLAFKAVRGKMVNAGHSRGYINRQMGHIVRLFKWGVENEMVPASVHQALATVSGLRKGRTEAPDHAPVQPVPEADIQATLPKLPEVAADMVRFQRLTGCRPDEVCIVKPCDVDRSNDVWVFRPESHKTEHQGRERTIHIGPKAQAILSPYLLREADGYAFSPIDSERKRRAEQRARRKTKVQPSQVDRSKAKTEHKPGGRYTTGSYRRAIHRACDRAGIDRWSPNRLRHSAGTEIRKQFGLEAAQVTLGHAQADITQIYAERDAELAREVARKIG
jgi:integrase